MADYPACMGAHEVLRRASKEKNLRVHGSDGRRRRKPSGFMAPTSVEGENPQGSRLRRASKRETLKVHGSDEHRRAKPSGFTAPTSVEGENPQGSRLRRASKGKTLRVRGSDERRRRRTLPVLVPPILVEGHEDDDARGDDGKDGHKVHRRTVSEQHVNQKEPQKKDAHGLGVADLATGHSVVFDEDVRQSRPSLHLRDEAVGDGVEGEAGRGFDAQLGGDVLAVRQDGVYADVEAGGDLFVRQTFDN